MTLSAIDPAEIDAAFDRGDADAATALVERAGQQLLAGRLDIPLDRLEAWLERLRDRLQSRPWLLYSQSMLWNGQRRLALAGVALARAERLFSELTDPVERERALTMVKLAQGVVAERGGNFAAARRHFAEARKLLPTAPVEESWFGASDVDRWRQQDPSGAAAFYGEAIPALRLAGDPLLLARGLTNFAHELLRRGEPALAHRAAVEAVELKRGVDSEASLANALNTLGVSETQLGLHDRARRTLEEAADLASRSANRLIWAYALNNHAELERDAGAYDLAADLYARSEHIKEEVGDRYGLAYGLRSRAAMARRAGDLAAARALIDRALALREPIGDPHEAAQMRIEQAFIEIAAGHADVAKGQLEEARLLAEETDAKALAVLARLGLSAAGDARADEAGALALAGQHRLAAAIAPEIAFLRLAVPGAPLAGGARATARVLGDFMLELDGKAVDLGSWRSKRAGELVRALIARRRSHPTRDELIDWLWPDAGDSGPELNAAVNAARRGLEQVSPGKEWIVREGDRYHFADVARVDADELVRAYDAARAAIAAGHRERAAALLDDALEMAAGEPYATDRYAEWCAAERAELTELIQLAREAAARIALDLGRPEDAIRRAVAAVAAEPARESAHQLLIRAHVVRGDRASAVRALNACRDALRREVGVDPSPATTAILAPLTFSADAGAPQRGERATRT